MAKKLNKNYGNAFEGLEKWANGMDAIFASMKPIPTKKQQRKLDAQAAREKEKTFIVKVTVKEAEPAPETIETTVVETANEAVPAKETKPVEKPEAKTEVKAEKAEPVKAEEKTEVNKEEAKASIPKVTPPTQEKKAEPKPQSKKVEAKETKPQQPQKPKQEKTEKKAEHKTEKKSKESPKLVAAQIAGIAPDGRAIDANGSPMFSASGLPLVMNPATGRFEEAIPIPPVAQQPVVQAQA